MPTERLPESDNISAEQLEFAIFCIENLAIRLGIDGSAAYHLLTTQSHVLEDYILPHYDVLHTQSKAYIIDDILDFLRTLKVCL